MIYTIVFILQFTPFWAIPSAMICAQFAYLYWLKDRRIMALLLLCIMMLCVCLIGFYIWAGGHAGVAEQLL